MTSRNKNDVKKLFELWCELNQDGTITESFPENYRDKKTIADIPNFAFPCELEGESVQSYSFVLTTDDSKWRFGFCRQDPKAKTAMVLITYLPWHDTFLRLLAVFAELRRPNVPKQEFRAFIKDVYNKGVPEVDASFEIFYNAGQNYFVFERPRQFQLPSIPENHNLNLYYNFVDPKNMIAVFAAMLAERRIIFTSRRLDRLSSCIQAAHAFLYPMVWQHIFIPVLPMKLKDYLSAPMPYLIGVPEPVLDLMTPEELGEVVILNCDTKIFESPFDDVHELPNEIVTQLKKQLSNSNEHIGDRVSKIFLGVLVQLIGTYRDGVDFRETGKVFNRERFIESRPSHLRPFLTKMMELQIFQQFVDERLEMLNTGLGFSDEFELETALYAEKMKKRGRNYAFLKNVKDKTNPAVKSAVKSVKEGSRGVKTAYKDLKSKFREIPGTTNFRSHLNSNSQHDRIDGGFQLGLGIGKANGGSGVGIRSAPSSPVFSRRSQGGGAVGNFQYASPKALNGTAQQLRPQRAPAPLATSNSSAHIHTVATHALADTNTNLGTSPTVSPASSVSSSDMNLSQELQNHPLFKTPNVDRSLKPTAQISAQQGKPARPPPPAHYYNHPYLAQRSATHLQLVSTTATNSPQSIINQHRKRIEQAKMLVAHSNLATATAAPHNKIITTDSTYDNPPEMLSPPVPPRRQCSANLSDTSSFTSAVNLSDNDCFKDSTQRFSSSNTSTISSSSSSSSMSGASFVSAMSSVSHHLLANAGVDAPKPIPRNKRDKESLRSLQPPQQLKVQQPNQQQKPNTSGSLTSVMNSTATTTSMSSWHEDTSNDLISLEDSHNSSFDLEDFDPLNQNARPLPYFNNQNATTTTMKSTTLPSASISNPIYPYFTQASNMNGRSVLDTTPPDLQPQPPPLPSTSPPRDDDFELLRKYGLDQFNLNTANESNANDGASILNDVTTAMSTTIKAQQNTAKTTGRNNWTTFD